VITQEEMIAYKTVTPGMLKFLAACVQAKTTVLISGGTGSGKTTTLNALSRFIPEEERIVTIEDTAELQLQQRHVVKFETRPPNLNKEGGINQRQLLRTALRMRPDRIIVGECRGAEALDMLQAMNTGVEGSMSTVHANTPKDAFLAPGDAGPDGGSGDSFARDSAAACVRHQDGGAGDATSGRHA
jgi:pilus assembly protein CpaF